MATIVLVVVFLYGAVFARPRMSQLVGGVDIADRIAETLVTADEQEVVDLEKEDTVSITIQNNPVGGIDRVEKLLLVEEMPIVDEENEVKASRTPQNTDKDYIEPLWSCSDTDRKKKFVFIHIFKTAGHDYFSVLQILCSASSLLTHALLIVIIGSSMRRLLSTYAETCNAAYAQVINCAPVKLESIPTGKWTKEKFSKGRHGSACKLTKTVFRNNSIIDLNTQSAAINTTFLEDARIDIMGGHVTLGTDQDWKGDDGRHVDVQYLAFFRQGMRKFVSGILYMNRDMSFDEAVNEVKRKVKQKVARSEYLLDVKYMIAPNQWAASRNKTLTPEETANLIIQNLKDNNVLVGIVERMPESLEMLQHVIDKDGDLNTMFESFGKRAPGESNVTKVIVANKSRLSSSEVLEKVMKDEAFMNVMREFVKWDDMVYRFALDMHMRQYLAFQQRESV